MSVKMCRRCVVVAAVVVQKRRWPLESLDGSVQQDMDPQNL